MNFTSKLLMVSAVVSLSGCSYIYGEDGLIKDDKYDYLDAKVTKDAKVPEGLVQKNKVDFAQIPEIGEKGKLAPLGKQVAAQAPVQILAVLENIRVDKAASLPAVFIQEEKDFILKTIEEMLASYEINPKVDRANYEVDSGWLAIDERGVWLGVEPEDEVDEFRAKYRFSITDGRVAGENRLEVERVKAQKLNDDTEQWIDVPSFWQDSAEMLNVLISQYDKAISKRSKNNQNNVIVGFKVNLGKDDNGDAALITESKRETVWEKLPLVLESTGFVVKDKDTSLQIYFIEYAYEEPGFFASLFGEQDLSLPIEEGSYQVVLSSIGDNTAMTFKDGQGVAINDDLMVKLYPALAKYFGSKNK